jgi:hypothetical protein
MQMVALTLGYVVNSQGGKYEGLLSIYNPRQVEIDIPIRMERWEIFHHMKRTNWELVKSDSKSSLGKRDKTQFVSEGTVTAQFFYIKDLTAQWDVLELCFYWNSGEDKTLRLGEVPVITLTDSTEILDDRYPVSSASEDDYWHSLKKVQSMGWELVGEDRASPFPALIGQQHNDVVSIMYFKRLALLP